MGIQLEIAVYDMYMCICVHKVNNPGHIHVRIRYVVCHGPINYIKWPITCTWRLYTQRRYNTKINDVMR